MHPFHFYCIAGGLGNNPAAPGNHNYYWYEAQGADRLWIIPWDLDHSMRESTMLPHIALDWRTKPTAEQCNVCQGGGRRALDSPAGCDRVIQNFQSWQVAYDAKIDAFLTGPFSQAAVNEKLEQWTQQLTAAGFPVPDAAISGLEGFLERARMNRGFPYTQP
jgi:hypothetical protein